MTRRRPKVCAQPGCPTLTVGTYCPKHLPADDRRPNSHQRGYDRIWRDLSARTLRRRQTCECVDPACVCGGAGCQAPSTEVDHKVTIRYFATRRQADHPTNLAALCHRCHASKTARRDRPSFETPDHPRQTSETSETPDHPR